MIRFRNDANEMYGDAAVPAARLGYWRAVRNRVVNLEMMTAEFPEQPVIPLPSPQTTATTAPAQGQ